jgi:hypothetical protein
MVNTQVPTAGEQKFARQAGGGNKMTYHLKRNALTTAAAVALVLGTSAAWAGSPHFVSCTLVLSGNTLTVLAKEAGLGNEEQVDAQLTATGLCINSGGKHPKAVNKTGVAAAGQFPVQNGKAEISLSATAVFQPSCSPPMTVQFTDILVTDVTSGISTTCPSP